MAVDRRVGAPGAASCAGFFTALGVINLLRFVLPRVQVEWPGTIVKGLAGPLRSILSVWIFFLGTAALLQLTPLALDPRTSAELEACL